MVYIYISLLDRYYYNHLQTQFIKVSIQNISNIKNSTLKKIQKYINKNAKRMKGTDCNNDNNRIHILHIRIIWRNRYSVFEAAAGGNSI